MRKSSTTKTVWLNCKLRLKYLIHVCDVQNMSGEWVTKDCKEKAEKGRVAEDDQN